MLFLMDFIFFLIYIVFNSLISSTFCEQYMINNQTAKRGGRVQNLSARYQLQFEIMLVSSCTERTKSSNQTGKLLTLQLG